LTADSRDTKILIERTLTLHKLSLNIPLSHQGPTFTVSHPDERCCPRAPADLWLNAAYENGRPALLLLLSGTLPVTFRNAVYRFPISVWIPQSYPREAPMVFVIPTQDMVVRPGQHVSGEGRVYHHYLAHWADAWDVSGLTLFKSLDQTSSFKLSR
jgi:hypothetical protein